MLRFLILDAYCGLMLPLTREKNPKTNLGVFGDWMEACLCQQKWILRQLVDYVWGNTMRLFLVLLLLLLLL